MKERRMKNKKIIALAIIFAFILNICLIAFVAQTALSGGDTAAMAEDSEIKIKFFPVNSKADISKGVIPDSSGRITVAVSLSKVDATVSLTVKTRDKSAIAGIDYEAQEKKITLTATSKTTDTQYLTVQTYKTDADNLVLADATSNVGVTRIFEIVLCDVTSSKDYVVTDEDGKERSASLDCRVMTRYNYQYEEKDGEYYFTDYLYGKSFSSVWFGGNIHDAKIYSQEPSGWTGVSVDNNENYHFVKTFSQFIPYDYMQMYRNTGWADVYYGGSATISENGWYTGSTPAKLELKGSDGIQAFYSEYYDPKSSGSPILFGEWRFANNNSSDYRYKLTDNAQKWLENNTGYTVSNKNDPMYNHAYNYYSRRYYNFPSVSGKVYKNNSEEMTLSIYRDSTWKMVFESLRIDSELYDTTAPVIKSTSLDNASYTDDKVLRFSVRFSEPVQISTTEGAEIIGYADNNSAYQLKFKYAGGAGTDTLYFECDLKVWNEKTTIKTINFDDSSFNGLKGKGIADYAYNFDMANNEADLSFKSAEYKVDIDMREPQITLKIDDTSVARSHTVSIDIENMAASNSKLYYAWVKEDETPSEYRIKANTLSEEIALSGVDGKYKLYVKAQSAYGKIAEGFTYAMIFDNTPVKVSDVDIGTPNTASKERTIRLTFSDTDLEKLYVRYRNRSDTSWALLKELTEYSDNGITVNGSKDLNLKEDQRGEYYFRFETVDKAGNEAVYETSDFYLFDMSDYCEGTFIPEGTKYTKDGFSFKDVPTYKKDGFSLTFKPEGTISGDLTVSSLYKGGEKSSNPEDYFKVEGGKVTYIGKSGGFFTIQFNYGTQKTTAYSFYLAGEDDAVAGYTAMKDGKLSVNKVWTANVSYYYMKANDTVATAANYNTEKNLSLVFSSADKAKSYFTFMEKQDLYLLTLNETDASYLNGDGGNSSMAKASADKNTEAKAGQTWIRYKVIGWNQDTQAQYWCYYFYSDNPVSEITDIPDNLNAAIANVVNKIMEKGGYIYLTKQDGLDARNVPVIDSSRVRDKALSAYTTKSGATLGKKVASYEGDSGIYTASGSKGVIDVIAAKLTASEYSSLYYAKKGDNNFEELQLAVGTYYLKDLITGSGEYTIIERDENGVRAYDVYIDNDSPFVTAVTNDADKTVINSNSLTNGGTFYYKSFKFIELSDEDDYAYVAIYDSATRRRLIAAYLKNELKNVSLAEGSYYLDVADRSGNLYSFYLKVSKTSVADCCTITQSNTNISFVCNYEDRSAIKEFRITLDGTVLTTDINDLNINNKITFVEGGDYSFYVSDLYGNEYEKAVKFEKEAPKVTWYYDNGTENVKYNDSDIAPVQVGMTMTRMGESSFLITSKGDVKFRFPAAEGYSYEFLSGSGSESSAGIYNDVTIKSTSWQVKIFYEDDSKAYVTYTGKVDSTPPTVSVTTNRAKYTYADETDDVIAVYLENHPEAKVKDIINLQDVSIASADMVTEAVNRGEVVVGSLVAVSVSDLSGVYEWSYVYGEETVSYNSTTGFPKKVYFSKEGKYTITAVDKMGNATSFPFEIGKSEYTDLGVDGLWGVQSIVGHTSVNAKICGAGAFVFVLDGEYFKLTTDGSNLVRTILKVAEATDGSLTAEKETKNLCESLGTTPVTVKANSEYGIITVYKKDDVVYLDINLDKSYFGKEEHSFDIKMRVQSDYVVESQSVEGTISDAVVYYDYEAGEKKGSLTETLYVNGDFTIKVPKSDVIGENNVGYFRYSETGKYGFDFHFWGDEKDKTLADIGVYDKENNAYKFSKQGFYEFTVYSKYGNATVTQVVYSVGIKVVGGVEYKDGTTYEYAESEEFYSDKAVYFRVYKNAKCVVEDKDGTTLSEDKYTRIVSADYYVLTVEGEGDYVFSFSDEFGNASEKKAHIKTLVVDYSDEWIDGFNKDALRKDEGYTNALTKLVKDKICDDGIKYVGVKYGEKTTIVYDLLSDKKVDFCDDYVIGAAGDGEYIVTFRNIYGNKVEKAVRYRAKSTLTATRVTRNMEKTEYVVDSSVSTLWSNKTMTFASAAKTAKLKIDSVEKDLPYALEFNSSSESGKYEYEVEYIDEYGFAFAFRCVLYRGSVEVTPTEMTVKDGVTRDGVAVTFADSCTAEISLNGVSLGSYENGRKYYRDGNYVITVKDVAGNVAAYTVKRDSVAEFCFYTDSSDNRLTSGEIINDSVVTFAPLNGDSVSYYTVYKDGEIVEYDSNTFSEAGRWDIVLADEAGNKDRFAFYIITHALTSFEYTTPQGYKITEITRKTASGKIDYLEAVEDKGDSSYFKFSEEGEYEAIMTSGITGKSSGFKLTIDLTVPKITLEGAEVGGTTKSNVKISGYEAGDTVYIYKDGVLRNTIKVVSLSDVPEISEKGDYKIVVVNAAGGRSEVEFSRIYTANIATSVLIIAVIVAAVIGLFVGLVFRKRSRVE